MVLREVKWAEVRFVAEVVEQMKYLQVFDTAVFPAETLEKLGKYQYLIQGYQVSTNFH